LWFGIISPTFLRPELIPGPKIVFALAGNTDPLDLGSVNAPPPLEHRQSGVGWSGEAASRKLQASSLTIQNIGL